MIKNSTHGQEIDTEVVLHAMITKYRKTEYVKVEYSPTRKENEENNDLIETETKELKKLLGL